MYTIQRWGLFAFVGCVVLGGSGCATHTGRGALAGTGIGAATGALVGSATGRPGAGALIGAGVGAATGGLVGNAMDEQERRHQQQLAQAAATAPQPMSINDVVQMSGEGVSDELIVAQIRNSGSVFRLEASDITALSKSGVSNHVIQAMMDTGRRPVVVRQPRTVVVEPAPVVVYEPAPPPPPHVSVGFGYYGHPRRW
jgi:uncharacterized membrane protein YebE (DUF533 family)